VDLQNLRTRARRRRLEEAFEARIRRGICFLQDDLSVANGPGATVRADINNQLQSLGTLMYGAAEPAVKYAEMFWADSTNGLLKQRNAANTAWLVRGTLAETFIITKTAAYNIGVGDYLRVFDSTGTYTVTFTAVATLGDGFNCVVRNSGTGAITLDPNASEQINGATTLVLAAGQTAYIYCDGTKLIANIVMTSQVIVGVFGRVTKTANYTITAADFTCLGDTTAGGFTFTLPAAPTDGEIHNVKKISADANVLTIARNGKNIEGAAADIAIDSSGRPNYQLQYDSNSGGWWIL